VTEKNNSPSERRISLKTANLHIRCLEAGKVSNLTHRAVMLRNVISKQDFLLEKYPNALEEEST
jgi:hypothetical protein